MSLASKFCFKIWHLNLRFGFWHLKIDANNSSGTSLSQVIPKFEPFGSSSITFFSNSRTSEPGLWTQVRVARTWPWAAGYYPPIRVPAQHSLKGGGDENRRVFSGGGELKVSWVKFLVLIPSGTHRRARVVSLDPLPPVLSPSCLSLFFTRALSLSLSLSSCLFIKIVAFISIGSKKCI